MKTYRNYKKGGNKTKRTHSELTNKYTQQRIVTMFLQMLNTVKLYHWKTSSYAQHKATDELFESLDKVNGVRIIPKNVGFILLKLI